ncbi:MAG: hypothetical protein ACI9DF_004605, partial [Verrucomicrobiales bacterium]
GHDVDERVTDGASDEGVEYRGDLFAIVLT